MYLLSPEGKTVIHIPGVEVVHSIQAPINIPGNRLVQIKMEPGKMQPPQGGSRKRPLGLSLDLNSASAKKKQVQSLLTSPDVQMLKLTSPELEKFLSQNPTLATPTPSGYIFPKSVTEEQAMYAKGFEEALEHLRATEPTVVGGGANETDTKMAAANTLANLSTASVPHTNLNLTRNPPPPMADMTSLPGPGCVPISLQSSLPPSRPTSGASGSYDSESYQVPDGLKIKDEPDDRSLSGSEYGSEEMMRSPPNTGVSNTGMSPIDMETQEKIKLDRKRMRNRLAASKCRKRKLERISQLDERVAALKNENADLAAVVKKMKAGVALLKQEVIEHVNSGCEIRMTDSGTY